MCERNKFTLIEMMVVISVIGVLMTLLLPSLQNARLTSMKALCSSNLKQIFIAESNYTSSNNGQITPANSGASGVYLSFDDLLAIYMGRDIDQEQKEDNYLLKENFLNAGSMSQSLMCPNDNTERNISSRIPKSYVGNGRRIGMPVLENDNSWGPMRDNWAPFAAQIPDSSGTISFTEWHTSNNYAGRINMAALNKAEQLVDSDGGGWASPHGKYLKYNFAYWDGHVVQKSVDATCNTRGNPSGKEWSLNPND